MRALPLLAALLLPVSAMARADAPPAVRAMRFRATNAPAARAWQRQAREKLFALMMGGHKPARVPLEPKVLRTEVNVRGGYRLEEITLRSLQDRTIHAWLAVPLHTKKPVGAVLALHGHGGVGEEIVRGQSLYWYGRALAEMGYVVISPDIGQHTLQHSDWSLMGERTWDAIRCIDYLETREEVDRKRIAVAGLSLGGETTMYVAALDERIRAADSAGWLTTVANMKNGHCPCWNFGGLEENFDFADIFACVAPRPLVCEIGALERAPGGFPVTIARGALDELKEAYRVFGAENKLRFDSHLYGHVFVGKLFWDPLRGEIGEAGPWQAGASERDELDRRGEIARRCFAGALGVLDGWWATRDKELNLYPRRLDQPVWAPQDNAADMLPFLFLTAHYVAPEKLAEVEKAFRAEQKITNRLGVLPDWYSIEKRDWLYKDLSIPRLIFGASEYCKDGILPMTEVMGRGPWTARMEELLPAIFAQAKVESRYGLLPADDTEVNGDLLQALSRTYCLTGDEKYWQWGARIADAYCFEVLPGAGGLPAYKWDFTKHRIVQDHFSLNDHGNEIAGGLTEFYIASKERHADRAASYRPALARMFRMLLEHGRNEDGIWYGVLRASDGAPLDRNPPDTWGYALSATCSFGRAAELPEFEEAARGALRHLDNPRYLDWAGGADSFADSIEGGLLLLNRYPEPVGFRWLDRILPVFLAKQRDDGIVEGWYGDGNSARTWLMAALYYTQGTHGLPWRDDLKVGAVRDVEAVTIGVSADKAWEGKLFFDTPRHRTHFRLPMNYPRLNEFPEWFTVDAEKTYIVRIGGGPERKMSGAELTSGLPLRLKTGGRMTVRVTPQ